jgi:beta-lactam-binding protein with PASTA domain
VVPGLPPQLDALVASATNRDPARRPSDASHFHAAAGEVYRSLPPDIDARLAAVAPVEPAPEGATQTINRTQALGMGGLGPPGGHGATHTFSPHTMAISQGDMQGPPPPPTLKDRLLNPPGLYGVIAGAVVLVLLLGTVVWLSVGDSQKVPSLVGVSESDARVKADRLGLKVKVGDSRYDNKVPKDMVVDVSPKVGTKVDKGALLTLTMSKGKKPVAIPDVRGMPLAQAKQTLQTKGLKPGDEVQQASTTVPAGNVIRTRPGAGAARSPDDPITIVVSTGIKMPDLSNMKRDKATEALTKLGLSAQWQEQDPTSGQPENTVIGQNPPPGTAVSRGQAVQVTVTKGTQCQWFNPFCKSGGNTQVSVPGVVGQPMVNAAAALRAAGFQVNVRSGGPQDVVTGQDPPPNTPQQQGSNVTIWH